ncbi:hypothetical protein [Pararhodobacter oceanensis]|uniref:hypothetical protein n=1 Tax=Pararhodobacter oceanensis TaxID=2172121 RepID=UPI00140357FA|nr:hypothetical protein [Pararhodobacter oceanensis]
MDYVLPAARGLRTLYALSIDRLWFALAVIAGLMIAAELAELFWAMQAPSVEGLVFQ